MNQEIEQIVKSLNIILRKLKVIENQITSQAKYIELYVAKCPPALNANNKLIDNMKSTRTLIEILRDEVDELHQIITALFYAKK